MRPNNRRLRRIESNLLKKCESMCSFMLIIKHKNGGYEYKGRKYEKIEDVRDYNPAAFNLIVAREI